MQPNPVLKKLGLSETDRVALLHMDDVGMCHAALTAYQELMDFGLVATAAVMVPCPWFPATAEYVRARPNLDMGVHVTLTSEWANYRWGPISTADKSSGMIDDEGYFYRGEDAAREHGDPDAVKREILAQIDRAKAAGIEPTHIDTHMGTVFHQKFLKQYIEAAQQHRIPAFIMRWSEEEMRAAWLDEESIRAASNLVKYLELSGYPLVDTMEAMPLDKAFDFEERLALTKQKFAALQPGITHFLMHASHDTPELRAVAPDWRARVGDLQVFQSDELRRYVQQEGIYILGYRALKETIPA